MKKSLITLFIFCFIIPFNSFSQDEKQQGHTNINKFRQLYDQFASPNIYRTASGAPGPAYYQQRADYKINVELDDKNKKYMVMKPLLTQTILQKHLVTCGFSWTKM